MGAKAFGPVQAAVGPRRCVAVGQCVLVHSNCCSTRDYEDERRIFARAGRTHEQGKVRFSLMIIHVMETIDEEENEAAFKGMAP